MTKKHFKFNGWRLIQLTGFFLVLLGVAFSLSSFKVNILLYFGLVSVLIGAINVLIYYIFIGTHSHKKHLKKQHDDKLKLTLKNK